MKKIVGIVIVSILIGVSIFAMRPNVGSVEMYTGSIESESIKINNEVSGILEKLLVHEGEYVEKNQLIGELNVDELKLELIKLQKGLSGAKAELNNAYDGTRQEEVEKAKIQLEQQETLVDAREKDYLYKLDYTEKLKILEDEDSISKQMYEEAQLAMGKSQDEYKAAQKQYEYLKEHLSLLKKGLSEQEVLVVKSRLDVNQATIDLLNYKISKALVYAKSEGVIKDLNFSEGEYIPVYSNMGSISEVKRLWTKIYIPQIQLNQVKINGILDIKVDGLENPISGKISYIAENGEFTPKNVESKESKQEIVFEVKLEIVDNHGYLKPGMLVDVYLGDESNE